MSGFLCRRLASNVVNPLPAASISFLTSYAYRLSQTQTQTQTQTLTLTLTLLRHDRYFHLHRIAPLANSGVLLRTRFQNPTPLQLIIRQRLLYSTTNESSESELKYPSKNSSSGLKHQEIEGPTVERDMSPLANEAREVSQSLMKTMYDLSKLLGLLGLAQLGLGAWIAYTTRSSPFTTEVSVMSVVAFGFPFSMAFMLRQSLKSMHFFKKMEEIGRLQILTSTMQISKQLNLFFLRTRGVTYLCLAGLPLGFFFSLFSTSYS